jgi:phosphate:Na+ symporter
MEAFTPDNPVAQIANVHTVFNIVTTAVLLPFGGLMVELTKKILPETQQEEDSVRRLKYIQPLETHYELGHNALAITQIGNELVRMLQMVKENLHKSFDVAITGNCPADVIEEIEDREDYIDYLNVEISKYITTLMVTEMSAEDSNIINKYYTVSNNLERVGDHARNIEGYAKNLAKWGRKFSDFAVGEIIEMQNVCNHALDNLLKGINDELPSNTNILSEAAKDEQKIDDMEEQFRKFQIERLQAGECQAESSLVFSEMLTDFERIGDHALNISDEIIRMKLCS